MTTPTYEELLAALKELSYWADAECSDNRYLNDAIVVADRLIRAATNSVPQ